MHVLGLGELFQPKGAPTGPTTEKATEILRNAYSNQDGHLSKDEIKKVFSQMGSYWPGFRASQGLKKADADGDRFVQGNKEIGKLAKYIMKVNQ